jgi:HAMP domain-containing protein
MRLPLYVKLMVSYLLVVALVFVPTFVYLRTTQARELRESLESDMRAELGVLVDHISASSPDGLDHAAQELIALRHRRVTVVATSGRVLADSWANKDEMDNHGDRPEIRDALTSPDGIGSALRHSATVGKDLFYCAMRFPSTGPPRGVVRLAVPATAVLATVSRTTFFLNQAGALAITAAIIFSLLAALFFARPLGRITDGARALASGDFGPSLEVDRNDEIGDLAKALFELGARLRGRLLGAGVDRATLQAVIDELPVGVVLFDAAGTPLLVGAGAREVCGLGPQKEEERLVSIFKMPEQAVLAADVLRDGQAREAALTLPWLPEAKLLARWFAVYASDGSRRAALVLLPAPDRAGTDRALGAAAKALRQAALDVADPALGASLLRTALAAEAAIPPAPPNPDALHPMALADLCAGAVSDLRPLLQAGGMRVELSLQASDGEIVESGDRCQRALRAFLAAAVEADEPPVVLKLRDKSTDAGLRLSLPFALGSGAIATAAEALRALGGDAGSSDEGEPPESWLVFPRA